jgi:hypothetical protein
MDLQSAFQQINWFSVIVATLAAFAIGSVWYSPVLLGKTWQRENKIKDEDIKNANMPLIFGTTFILTLIGAIVLEMFLGPGATAGSGISAGFLIGLAWVATAIGTNYLYARKSLTLFLIDAGYFVVFYPVMGLILGLWK